jgi:hypothetical protein
MDSSEVNADLSKYIDHEVEKLAEANSFSQELERAVKKALGNQAGGTFLWVSLMINELENTPKYGVVGKLNLLPKGA